LPLLQNVQICSSVYPASLSIGIRVLFWVIKQLGCEVTQSEEWENLLFLLQLSLNLPPHLKHLLANKYPMSNVSYAINPVTLEMSL
jgi:hypothetical protein